MARLGGLLIQGIRSFGPDEQDRQVIHFNSPLTLILGRNGCGKTTIIEALKYSTIGEFPFGQGAAFIHDPRMANEVTVTEPALPYLIPSLTMQSYFLSMRFQKQDALVPEQTENPLSPPILLRVALFASFSYFTFLNCPVFFFFNFV